MKSKIQLMELFALIICLLFEFSLDAQIQDIKKNSKENKTNNSNNNSSNTGSSNKRSSRSNDIDSEDVFGCIGSFFEIFSGCLSALPDNSEDNFVDNSNDVDDYPYLPPVERENNIIPQNQNLESVDSFSTKNQKIHPENNGLNNNQKINNDDHLIIENEKINNNENQSLDSEKDSAEYSFDINANFAIGFEPSTEKTYKYYNFLPGIRANLDWFAIDFRFNILTEFSQDLPDAFKTWDLLFLFNIKADDNTKIIFGTGIHKEEYGSTIFNQHYFEAKIGLSENRDYLDFEGRLTFDYSTSEIPYSEFGIHYNKRIMNSEKLNGYILIGGMYQNYYSSTDIWAFRVGIKLNIH